MYNIPLIGDAIIDPFLSPCIIQKFSSIDLGCSHPASTATAKSSLGCAALGDADDCVLRQRVSKEVMRNAFENIPQIAGWP
jgi:hypothetical protein